MTPSIKIVNAETGEEIEREMNAEELSQLKADQEEAKADKEKDAEIQAKRETALAKLEALGLDEDDLKALGL